MKAMNFLLVGFLVLVIPSSSSAIIYKWVDKDGKTHFTDNPSSAPLNVNPIPVKSVSKEKNKENASPMETPSKNQYKLIIPTKGLGKRASRGSVNMMSACDSNVEEEKYRSFLEMVQSTFVCKKGTIAHPKKDWSCKPAEKGGDWCKKKDGTGVSLGCFLEYECLEETPAYNRANYKDLLAKYEADKKTEKMAMERKFIDKAPNKDTPKTRNLVAYLDHLKTCSPFTRSPYAIMRNFPKMKDVIKGKNGDKCEVEIYMETSLMRKCLFRQETIALLTSPIEYEKAKKDIYSVSTTSKLSKEWSKDCKEVADE